MSFKTRFARRHAWNRYRENLVQFFLKSRNLFPANATAPFVPWCGKRYWNSPTKLLFIGKSVGAGNNELPYWMTRLSHWRRAAEHRNSAKVTDGYVRDQLST